MISWLALPLAFFSAFEGTSPVAAEVGRGGSDAAWAGDGCALEANPALAATASALEAGSGWTRPLDLPGLDLSTLWAHGRIPSGTGLAIRWRNLTAADVYREDLAAVDISQEFGPWAAGGGIRCGRLEIEGRTIGHPVGWALGGTFSPAPRIRTGLSWEDLSGLGADGLPQPWTFRAGVSAAGADSAWNAQVGASRRQRESWSWEIGQELRLDPLRLRVGLRLSPWIYCAGIGGTWKGISVDYALEGDPTLGFQHHGSVSWKL